MRPDEVEVQDAPQGYKDFDQGEPVKYVINPNGLVAV
jgi:hypothetical protein